MKRGMLARLFERHKGEFEAETHWQPSPTVPMPARAERTPIIERHVRMPLEQAIISGLSAALFPTAIAIAGMFFEIWELGIADLVLIYLGSAFVFYSIIWFLLLIVDRFTLLLNEIIGVVERWLGVDLNKDGMIGKVGRRPETVRVETTDRENRSMRYDDLPVDTETLREVAHAVLQLRCNVSKRGLAKHTSLSVEKAAELLASMREAGFARFNTADKPESGTALTRDGLSLLEKVL